MEGTTDSLRALASNWSLAGDESLLTVLKTTHQKIISKCQEVNTKLDEMVSALDDASINLQNVNNKFMALSNSQFIESRVYDDESDLNIETEPVPPTPQPEPLDQLTLLKQSLNILDNAHETAEILDESDSDESDVEISVVLKPKDVYAHRPLPYIIGSQSWKNKWHAGLVIEDSDTDSTTSRPDVNIEQYSESDDDLHTDRLMPNNLSTNLSNSSSSLHSSPNVPDKKTPAAVAAELQAWLGNAPPPVKPFTSTYTSIAEHASLNKGVHEEPDDLSPQHSANKTVYRPHKPVTSTIFSDEPPPIDHQYTEIDSQEEEDIFAEINKKQPYNNNYTSQNNVDDLFGTITEDSDFNKQKVETSSKQKTTLFDEESEPELFVEKPKNITKESQSNRVENDDSSSKKPVGGISLFGSNKGTESIGAAILQRNRRKSSSESDDGKNIIKNETANEKIYNSDDDSEVNNANAIFDNLFAKAKQAEQKFMKPAKLDKSLINKSEPVKEKDQPVKEKAQTVIEKPKAVNDIFSDNIFDDIDDIFNDIKIPNKEVIKSAKSIFDDDADDLFADIAKKHTKVVNNTNTNIVASSSKNKSIFDSDDDLFGEVKTITKSNKQETAKIEPQNKRTENNNSSTKQLKREIKESFTTPESKEQKPKVKSKSIFDSDSDDDIFLSVKIKTANPKETIKSINVNTDTETDLIKEQKETNHQENLEPIEKQVFQSPALFEEDEIDDLFINANRTKEKSLGINNTDGIVPEHLPDFNRISKDEDFGDFEYNAEITQENDNVNINTKNLEVVDSEMQESNKVETESALFDNLKEDLFTKLQITDLKKTEEPVSKEDIIETSQEVEVQRNSSYTGVTVESEVEAQDRKENEIIDHEYSKTATQDVIEKGEIGEQHAQTSEPAKSNPALIPEQMPPILSPVFDDIFSEPPAFEKTKESKKTTNVNALFEDDSDDESLFFKKNDNISDEKPEIFSPSADFGIFADEPPALDVDFISKGNNNDSDLFSSVPKAAKTTHVIPNQPPEIDDWDDDLPNHKSITGSGKPINIPIEASDDLFLASNALNVKTATTVKIPASVKNIDIPDSTKELFSDTPKIPETSPKENTIKTKDIDQVSEITKTEVTETKKIGKINTKNFNINVQALVPGASPKKTTKERSNEDIIHINNTNKEEFITNVNESTEVDNTDPVTAKSITFESKPDSGILDNKLSKQRVKIQVKRRPSTRRARHEAVRKSVINNDDDTDNSSSIDDPKPITNENKTSNIISKAEPKIKDTQSIKNVNKQENEGVIDSDDKIKGQNSSKSKEQHNVEDFDRRNKSENTENINKATLKQYKINIHNEITKDLEFNKSADEIDANIEHKNDINQEVIGQLSPQRTTKVKYILNDEDIFKTNDILSKEEPNNEKIAENISRKTINSSNKESSNKNTATHSKSDQETKNITSTIKEVSKPAQPKGKSLFDLSDDEDDLFGKPTKKKVEVKTKLFDSDSEDDLFSGKKDKTVKKEKSKVKGSLFSDDDDDDLFGVKNKAVAETSKMPSKPAASKNTARSSDTAEIAFDDPLSMLDD